MIVVKIGNWWLLIKIDICLRHTWARQNTYYSVLCSSFLLKFIYHAFNLSVKILLMNRDEDPPFFCLNSKVEEWLMMTFVLENCLLYLFVVLDLDLGSILIDNPFFLSLKSGNKYYLFYLFLTTVWKMSFIVFLFSFEMLQTSKRNNGESRKQPKWQWLILSENRFHDAILTRRSDGNGTPTDFSVLFLAKAFHKEIPHGKSYRVTVSLLFHTTHSTNLPYN